MCETSEDKTLSGEQKQQNWDDNKWEQEVWTEDSEAEISDSNTEAGEPQDCEETD